MPISKPFLAKARRERRKELLRAREERKKKRGKREEGEEEDQGATLHFGSFKLIFVPCLHSRGKKVRSLTLKLHNDAILWLMHV